MANIIIVGANQCIGFHMVSRLLEKRNRVSVLDINIDNLYEFKDTYVDNFLSIIADARNTISIKEGVHATIEKFSKIDLAIHNACLCTFESEVDTDYDTYIKVMDVNYFGPLG